MFLKNIGICINETKLNLMYREENMKILTSNIYEFNLFPEIVIVSKVLDKKETNQFIRWNVK